MSTFTRSLLWSPERAERSHGQQGCRFDTSKKLISPRATRRGEARDAPRGGLCLSWEPCCAFLRAWGSSFFLEGSLLALPPLGGQKACLGPGASRWTNERFSTPMGLGGEPWWHSPSLNSIALAPANQMCPVALLLPRGSFPPFFEQLFYWGERQGWGSQRQTRGP
jgi:hypothetical protein